MKLIQKDGRSKYAIKNNKGEYFVGEGNKNGFEWNKTPKELKLHTKAYYEWVAPRIGLILSNCTFIKMK